MSGDGSAVGRGRHVRPGPLRYGVAWIAAVLLLDTLGVVVLGNGLLVLLALSVANGLLLESMLERAGFDILESTYDGDFYAEYVCEWNGRS